MVREVSPGERGFGGPGSAEQRGGEGGADRVGRRAGQGRQAGRQAGRQGRAGQGTMQMQRGGAWEVEDAPARLRSTMRVAGSFCEGAGAICSVGGRFIAWQAAGHEASWSWSDQARRARTLLKPLCNTLLTPAIRRAS